MSKKENQMKELDRVSKSLSEELKNLHLEVKVKRDSEDQMKQVLKEYEKTISELVAEKEREKLTSEEERLRLIAERDQAVEDLRVSNRFIYFFLLILRIMYPFYSKILTRKIHLRSFSKVKNANAQSLLLQNVKKIFLEAGFIYTTYFDTKHHEKNGIWIRICICSVEKTCIVVVFWFLLLLSVKEFHLFPA